MIGRIGSHKILIIHHPSQNGEGITSVSTQLQLLTTAYTIFFFLITLSVYFRPLKAHTSTRSAPSPVTCPSVVVFSLVLYKKWRCKEPLSSAGIIFTTFQNTIDLRSVTEIYLCTCPRVSGWFLQIIDF